MHKRKAVRGERGVECSSFAIFNVGSLHVEDVILLKVDGNA